MNKPIPYKGPEPYIFISYSHKDSDRVWPIIDRMLKDGYRVWYDEGIDPGTEWNKIIAAKLNQCSRFIVFLTKNSIQSKFVRREINFADRKDKPILQIYLEDLTLSEDMELTLDDYQAIFWHAYPTRSEAFDKLYETDNMEQCHAGSAVEQDLTDAERRYREGFSLFYDKEDYEEAIAVLLPAAKQGHADAQFLLGGCYDEARDLPGPSIVDLGHDESIWWTRHAAEQGHALAQCVMGLHYQYHYSHDILDNLIEHRQVKRKAAYWYGLAAEQGEAQGCYYLGRCYHKGFGVTRDLERAAELYQQAIDLGDDRAEKYLKRMMFWSVMLPRFLYPVSFSDQE